MTPCVRIFYPSKFTHFFKQKTKTTTISNLKIVRCHALFSSYASLPSLPFRHSFWFSCKIVGTADFQTLKRPLCCRLIPDMTTLPGPSGPATFKQKCYFSRLILHLHGTQSCILNRKRTKSNLEKQRST